MRGSWIECPRCGRHVPLEKDGKATCECGMAAEIEIVWSPGRIREEYSPHRSPKQRK